MRVNSSIVSVHSILGVGLVALVVAACGAKSTPPPAASPPAAVAPATAVPAPSPTPATAPASAPAAAPTAAAPSAEHHGHKGHHPMVAMLVAELAKVGIRPEQKAAIDGIERDLAKPNDTASGAQTQLANDIADGATAGKLDKAKIDADVKKLAQAADSTAASMQEAMNKLHKTLDATQRKKLVELMGAKGKEHQEHMQGQMQEHEKGEHGPVQKLGELLGLTPEQREKLKGKLGAGMKADMAGMKAHHATMQKRMKAVGDAFATEKFDAKKVGIGEHSDEMVKMMTSRRTRFVEAVLSILTPEQRSKFAEHIRQNADPGDED